jgi:arylsulfatase A-like enzyme
VTRRARVLAALGRVAALGLLASTACTPETPPPDLALIVLDTVGPSHLSAYGYSRPTTPYLERFAREAVRFDRAYSTSTWTLPAHASAFTGLDAARHGADQVHQRLDPGFPTLAEELGRAGYQTAGFSNNPWISHDRGTARGFHTFDELFRARSAAPPPVERHRTVTALSRWLSNERDSKRPFFVFVNLSDAHFPYTPRWQRAKPLFPSQEEWGRALERMAALQPLNLIRRYYLGGVRNDLLAEGDVTVGRELYDGEIRYLDAVTEQLVDAIDAATTGPSVVAIVSDHGENFGEHDHMGHAFSLYDSTLRIALLVRGPGFAPGSTSDALVQISDLFPTLLGAAGATIPPEIDGRDLRRPEPNRALAALYAHPFQALRDFPAHQRDRLARHDRELRAAIVGSHKLIRGSDGSEEIYDLSRDPGEARPLGEVDEATRARLLEVAGDPREKPAATIDPLSDVDEATRRALEAMGYVQPRESARGD